MDCSCYFALVDELLEVGIRGFIGFAEQVVIADGEFFVVRR